MRFGCIVTKLKSTFDSLIFESTAKADKCAIGIVSRCRCNIFAIGNRSTGSCCGFNHSSIRKSFLFSPLNPLSVDYEACSRVIHSVCFESTASARESTQSRLAKLNSGRFKTEPPLSIWFRISNGDDWECYARK